MGRGAPKAQGNVWYEARIEAAKWNERLQSRLGAAEEMGLSEDAVKSAELGLYKFLPVDNAVLMADTYNASELLNHYGIRTMEDLDRAIERIGPIDITIFCKPIAKHGRNKRNDGKRIEDSTD